MHRVTVLGLLGLVVVGSVACAGALPVTPPPAPTLVSTPAPSCASWDGLWAGTTSQGREIRILVEDGAVTAVEFAALLSGDGWQAETERARQVRAQVSDDQFLVRFFEPHWAFEVSGLFQAEDRLEGLVLAGHQHPQGFGTARAIVSYTAARQHDETAGVGR